MLPPAHHQSITISNLPGARGGGHHPRKPMPWIGRSKHTVRWVRSGTRRPILSEKEIDDGRTAAIQWLHDGYPYVWGGSREPATIWFSRFSLSQGTIYQGPQYVGMRDSDVRICKRRSSTWPHSHPLFPASSRLVSLGGLLYSGCYQLPPSDKTETITSQCDGGCTAVDITPSSVHPPLEQHAQYAAQASGCNRRNPVSSQHVMSTLNH